MTDFLWIFTEGKKVLLEFAFAIGRVTLRRVERKERGRERELTFFPASRLGPRGPVESGWWLVPNSSEGGHVSKLTFSRACVVKESLRRGGWITYDKHLVQKSIWCICDLLSAELRSASASGQKRESSADYFFFIFFDRFQNSRINELTSMFRERVIAADSPRLISAIALPDVVPIRLTAPMTDKTSTPLYRRECTDYWRFILINTLAARLLRNQRHLVMRDRVIRNMTDDKFLGMI